MSRDRLELILQLRHPLLEVEDSLPVLETARAGVVLLTVLMPAILRVRRGAGHHVRTARSASEVHTPQ